MRQLHNFEFRLMNIISRNHIMDNTTRLFQSFICSLTLCSRLLNYFCFVYNKKNTNPSRALYS